MFELEKFGVKLGSKPDPELTGLADASDRSPWTLADGIKFGQTRALYDADGLVVLKIGIDTPVDIKNASDGAIYPVLVKYWPDGTIKRVLINFERTINWQDGE